MRLSYIFDMLASGELSNLYLADGGTGEIKADKKELVLRSINAGLTDLYTRFYLKRKVAHIPIILNEHKYSIDDPLCIEIIKVKHNDFELMPNVALGFYFLDNKTIYLTHSPNDGQLTITYKCYHPTLTQTDITRNTDIELPQAYLNALLYFCGARLLTSLPNQLDGDLNESQRYYQKYLAEIDMLSRVGVDVDDLDEFYPFNERGFV